jgi:hypothetical protein
MIVGCMAVDLQTFEATYQLSERGGQVVSSLRTPVSQSRFSVQRSHA